jgi:hypothetical protein
VWILLGFTQSADAQFLMLNAPVFIAQLFLITLVIYVFVPKFLIDKKYVLFIVFATLVLGFSAWCVSVLFVDIKNIYRPNESSKRRPA